MTVAELIAQLDQYEDDLDVMVKVPTCMNAQGFTWGYLSTISVFNTHEPDLFLMTPGDDE
jgi:hypothetical protein